MWLLRGASGQKIVLENAVLYLVSKATGICVSQLSRIRRGRKCNPVIAGIMLDYFGYEIKKVRKVDK